MPFHTKPLPRSSRTSSPRVAIEVSRSFRLIVIGGGALSGALAVCLYVALAGAPGRALLATAVLALAARPLMLLSGLSPKSIRRFQWTSDGRWYIQKARGAWRTVELLEGTTMVGSVVLLIWRNGACGRSYVLLDGAAADLHAFRLLRGRLRLEACGVRCPKDDNC